MTYYNKRVVKADDLCGVSSTTISPYKELN